MSRMLSCELSDELFQAVRRLAEAAGITPAQWVAESVQRDLAARPSSPENEANGTETTARPPIRSAAEASLRFESLIGAVDLGMATGADNDAIDADLIREYASTHEGP